MPQANYEKMEDIEVPENFWMILLYHIELLPKNIYEILNILLDH